MSYKDHPEENPEGYQWTNKLISKVYSKNNLSGRQTQLFVGEWIEILDDEDDLDDNIAHVRFHGGHGYIGKDDYGEKKYLEIFYIDVGQGDAILIQTPENRRVLIDGGSGKSAHSFLQMKYNLFEHPKLFDLVILTHPDKDHMYGLTRILKDKNVIPLKIIHNGISKKPKSEIGNFTKVDGEKYFIEIYDGIDELNDVLDEISVGQKDWYDTVRLADKRTQKYGPPMKYLRVDDTSNKIILDGDPLLVINILNPVSHTVEINSEKTHCLKWFTDDSHTVNGNSVGVLIEYGDLRFLMCGDMNDESEELFLQKHGATDLSANVFKAQHHGSQYFTTDYLSKVNPWVSVISSGLVNTHGHPSASLIGGLGKYTEDKVAIPVVFSTELAASYKKIPESVLKDKSIEGFKKSISGIIYVKTSQDWLAAGRVVSLSEKEGQNIETKWEWEAYAYDIKTGQLLQNDLKNPI